MRLNTLENKVRTTLETYKGTRDDDKLLFVVVYERYYGVNIYAPFRSVMLDPKLPSFESIRRTRQKLQQNNESLRGSDRKEKIRLEAQKDFLDYARE